MRCDMRRAFGTLFGMPDPGSFMGDAELARTRWRADPGAAFAAAIDGVLVGSNLAANWGSIGVVGPLTVAPDRWGRGVATRLMAPALARFAAWGAAEAGVFTIATSPQHLHLYQ
ncbi:MAG TPA: GNAT family N-acetyltransferase, partial [Thermomicrobiales bacterium]|nr:GNAT family N-acetyltransferase [Thermomicrobiales bacterium]